MLLKNLLLHMQIQVIMMSLYTSMSLGKFKSVTIPSAGEKMNKKLSYRANVSENCFNDFNTVLSHT